MISEIIKIEVNFISGRADRTINETLIILDITEIECNNCFTIHRVSVNNAKHSVASIALTLLLGILRCTGNGQISQLFASG